MGKGTVLASQSYFTRFEGRETKCNPDAVVASADLHMVYTKMQITARGVIIQDKNLALLKPLLPVPFNVFGTTVQEFSLVTNKQFHFSIK